MYRAGFTHYELRDLIPAQAHALILFVPASGCLMWTGRLTDSRRYREPQWRDTDTGRWYMLRRDFMTDQAHRGRMHYATNCGSRRCLTPDHQQWKVLPERPADRSARF